jgi:uncharacterized membrane protein
MDPYLLLKFVHVLLAIFALGSNLTYGIWLGIAGGDRDRVAFALRGIKTVDNAANLAYVLLLVTGLTLTFLGAIPLTTFWVAAALVLYAGVSIFSIAVFAPNSRRQVALLDTGGPDSPEFRAAAGRTRTFGIAVTLVIVAIVYLMVVKPTL